MNKSVLGTIIGAAILGLSKSKLGGKNKGKGKIVPLDFGYIGDRLIFSNHIPDDVKGIAKVEDNERQTFSIPSNLNIQFYVEESGVEFPEYPDMDELEEQLKMEEFEYNEELSEDDEDKQDWDQPDDVPEHYYYDYLEQKRDEAQMEHMDDCGQVLGELSHSLESDIRIALEESWRDDSTYFQNCQKYIGDTNIYITVESYSDEWEEDGYVKLQGQILVYCGNNPSFALAFIQDLKEFLLEGIDFELNSGPDFVKIDVMGKRPSKLRIR